MEDLTMAIFSPGPVVGRISGGLGGHVFSHNRGGMYMRTRAVPCQPSTPYKTNAMNYFALASQAWKALTDVQRAGWKQWASENLVTNRLGEAKELVANAAYVQLNSRVLWALGTQIDDPPIGAAPTPLLTITLTTDLGVGTFQLAYTATPLEAYQHLWISAAVLNSDAITYIKNRLKLVHVSAAEAASPLADLDTILDDRFGTLQVGQQVVVLAAVFDSATGLLSAPLRADSAVVETA